MNIENLFIYPHLEYEYLLIEACGSVVIKALCYKPEGREFDTR
jgi:hypothetical protein